MKCPVCKGKVRVVETRGFDTTIVRRRICVDCGYKFRSWETFDEEYIEVQERGKGREKRI